MEKKTKLTISGNPKKSFKSFDKVKSSDKKSVVIDNGIVCTLDSSSIKALELIQINNNVSIKGRFVGFDDLFEEIRLDHCFIM